MKPSEKRSGVEETVLVRVAWKVGEVLDRWFCLSCFPGTHSFGLFGDCAVVKPAAGGRVQSW